MNVKSARNAKEFIKVIGRDDRGRITKAIVPGHEARQYTVTVNRGKTVTCHCVLNQQQVGDDIHECIGNKGKAICYHCLAVLMLAGEEIQAEVVETDWEARRKVNELRGKSVQVFSAQGTGTVWMCFPRPGNAEATGDAA